MQIFSKRCVSTVELALLIFLYILFPKKHRGRVSRCSDFPEAFVHAALFCCPSHTVLVSLLPVTERKSHVLYCSLERTKRRIPMSGNVLDANFALYAGCITNCIFQRLHVGNALHESPFTAILRGLWAGVAVPLAGAPLFV